MYDFKEKKGNFEFHDNNLSKKKLVQGHVYYIYHCVASNHLLKIVHKHLRPEETK